MGLENPDGAVLRFPVTTSKTRAHVVARIIGWLDGGHDSEIECSCGEVLLGSRLTEHRRDAGLNTSHGGRAVPLNEPNQWLRARPRGRPFRVK